MVLTGFFYIKVTFHYFVLLLFHADALD